MENATKALLIAAAVLVAIIIISLTLGVVNQGRETISTADMSEADISAFNSKFLTYEGNSVSTDKVNSLLGTVLAHNQNEMKKANPTTNTVIVWKEREGNGIPLVHAGSNSYSKIIGTSCYKVTCMMKDGIVNKIIVETVP